MFVLHLPTIICNSSYRFDSNYKYFTKLSVSLVIINIKVFSNIGMKYSLLNSPFCSILESLSALKID